jgi:precorrin-2 dehydrogenase / sirohydrochlorin ferrochelatase
VPVTAVGAGPVAAAKVLPLLEGGARVTVVAPEVDPRLAGAAAVLRRAYAPGDLAGPPPARLVVAGTGVAAVDGAVAAEAAAVGAWCLRVDGRGDAAAPAVVRRGDLVLALATGAPALSARLRAELEALVDRRGWAAAAAALAALRRDPDVRRALAGVAPEARRRRWAAAVDVALAGAGAVAVHAALTADGTVDRTVDRAADGEV